MANVALNWHGTAGLAEIAAKFSFKHLLGCEHPLYSWEVHRALKGNYIE